MKQKWLITLNVFLIWALHLTVLFCIQPGSGGGAGWGNLGVLVIGGISLIVSASVGFLVLVVTHLMKRFNKQAKNPRFSVGAILSLLILCMVFQGVLVMANKGEVESLFLELIKEGIEKRYDEKYDLSLAAERGDIEKVKRLVDSKNVNSRNDVGYTPLERAVKFGDIELVKYLLAKGANPSGRSWKATPLSRAVGGGKWGIAKLLIESGANVQGHQAKAHIQSKGDQKVTVLHLAVESTTQNELESIDVFKMLLAKGADCDVPSSNSHITPIQLATLYGKTNLVALMQKSIKRMEPRRIKN
jgi:hypothetical protein